VDRLAFACVHTPHFIKWIPLVFRKDNENENNKMSEKVHVMHILGYKSARFYEVIAQEKDPKNTISDQPEVTSQNTQENSLSQPDQSEDHESNGANKKESDPEDVDDT
jgi:hypothetical protein